MALDVLRLGHRIFRDQRLTTHVFLTARALGAKHGLYTGQRDTSMEASVKKASRMWGGRFTVAYRDSPQCLHHFPGKIVHLTAYGLPFHRAIPVIKKEQNLLVVVGGEKVPPYVYERADWNLSVGTQPHSEVAALGIFLYALKGFSRFTKADRKIVPQKKGKKVILTAGRARSRRRA